MYGDSKRLENFQISNLLEMYGNSKRLEIFQISNLLEMHYLNSYHSLDVTYTSRS